MDAREGRLWVLNHEPYRPGDLSRLLLFLVKHVITHFIFALLYLLTPVSVLRPIECYRRNCIVKSLISTAFNMGCNVGCFQWTFFFVFLRSLFFCFVVAICDLVHGVETIFHLSYVLIASGNLF